MTDFHLLEKFWCARKIGDHYEVIEGNTGILKVCLEHVCTRKNKMFFKEIRK